MTERASSQPTPEQPIRHIDTLPLDSPDLHYLYNFTDHSVITNASDQSSSLRIVRERYGDENVRVSLAIVDGKHVAIPDNHGIYVDAKKWAEVNAIQDK